VEGSCGGRELFIDGVERIFLFLVGLWEGEGEIEGFLVLVALNYQVR